MLQCTTKANTAYYILTLNDTLRLTNVRHVMHRSLKLQNSDIKSIRLRCEFKVRMYIDLSNAKRVSWQRLDS